MSRRNTREAKARRRAERAEQRHRIDARSPDLEAVLRDELELLNGPAGQCMWADGCFVDWKWEVDMTEGDLVTRLCEPHFMLFAAENEDSIAAARTRWMSSFDE